MSVLSVRLFRLSRGLGSCFDRGRACAQVFWRLWWRDHRDSADLDMVIKVFGFTFYVGVFMAVVLEGILSSIAALILLGDDAAILAGMIRIVLEEGLYDKPFVEENAQKVHSLKSA